jgi:hypothetical protein
VRAVNGKNPQAADVRISAINERPPSDNDYQFDWFTGELLGFGSNVQVIPAAIWGAPVTSFNRDLVFKDKGLTSVIIPNSVTSIGDEAFNGNKLMSVTIGNSVTSIGRRAFYGGFYDEGKNQLRSVTIPDSVTSIGRQAFSSNQLTSVTIGNSVTSIEPYVFSSNPLTSVTIGNSVTSIGTKAFYEWRNQVTSVTIGAGVSLARDSIDDRKFTAFYNRNGKKAGTYVYDNRRWSLK